MPKYRNYAYCYKLIFTLLAIITLSANTLRAQCGNMDFTASKTEGCLPALVKFTAIGLPDGAVYWDFGKGYIAGGDIMYENFIEPGSYTVSLKVNLADGTECVKTKPDYLKFTTVSEPNFGADKTVICNSPAIVTLTDSTANVTRREWYINGTKLDQTDATIQHEFKTPGYKTVTLIVYGNSDCSSVKSKKNYIHVPETVGLDFCSVLKMNAGRNQITAAFSTDLDTSDIESVSWEFPGGSPSSSTGQSPSSVTYNNLSGSFDVTLVVKTKSGCVAKFTKKDLIRNYFSVNKTDLCVQEEGVVSISSADTSLDLESFVFYSEDIENSYYKGNGQYGIDFQGYGSVTLGAGFQYKHSSCRDSIIVPDVFSLIPPSADFFVKDSSQCSSSNTVHFMARYPNPPSGTNTYTWYVYDSVGNQISGSPIGPTSDSETDFIFTKDGVYTVQLIVSNTGGCADTVTKRGIVKIGVPNPKVELTKKQLTCTGDTLKVINKTTPRDLPQYPYTHKWIFQHQDSPNITYTYSEREPQIIITKPGKYTLNYSVENGPDCKNNLTITDVITVNGVAADFSADVTSGCAPLATTLKATVEAVLSSSGNNAVSYRWRVSPADGVSFADSTASTTAVSFTKNGCYQVTLVIWNADGCTSEIVKKRYICLGTIAKFKGKVNACKKDSVKIENTSELDPDFYRWSVSPSSDAIILPSNAAFEPTFIFLEDGCYTVTLITGKNIGPNCSDTFARTFCVKTPVSGFYSPDTNRTCAPVLARFFADTFPEASYIWNFGDGTVYITDNPAPIHTYEQNNIQGFDIKLITVSKYGCMDSFSRKDYMKVYGPVPYFIMKGADRLCGDETITFIDSSQEVRSYFMVWGDGSPVDSNKMGTHTYTYFDWTLDSNVFVPTMFALGDSNCLSSYRDTLVLYRPAEASFEVDTVGCAPLTLQFNNTSKYATYYSWDFDGDGEEDDTAANPAYTYKFKGTYTAILKAVTNKGCADFDSIEIVVAPKPEARYYTPQTMLCWEDTLKLFDSTISDVPVVKWHWDFGDSTYAGDTSTEQHPIYRYRNPGHHTIRLIIENQNGCLDTIYGKNAVYSMDSLPPDSIGIYYVTVENDSNNVKVVFQEREHFDFYKYHVYRDAGSGWVEIDTPTYVKDTIVYDDSLAIDIDSQSYCYRVMVEDFCGDTSKYSGTHCTMHLDAEIVAPLVCRVRWTPYIGWESISRYEVYRRRADEFRYNQIATVDPSADGALEFIDSNLCDFTYRYYVRAIHPVYSFFSSSNRDSVHPEYVYQDTALALHVTTVQDDSMTYSRWQRGKQPNVRMYVIDRWLQGLGWQDGYGATTDTFFIDKNVEVKKFSYRYRVRVQDMCDSVSPNSNIGTSILLAAEVANDVRYFKWNNYRDWPDSVQHYILQIRNDDGTFKTVITTGLDTEATDDGEYVEMNKATCYRVMAIEKNPVPDTSFSNTICAVIPSRIYIPNVFTPNDDGTNDLFGILPMSIFNGIVNEDLRFDFKIFNRRAVMVFHSNNYREHWDGSFRGYPLPEGVYVYSIEADGFDGVRYFLTGTFTLMR